MPKHIQHPEVAKYCEKLKKRRERRKRLLRELFLDFAKNSTLHGLRYITENGLHFVEKIFWFVTFSASVCISFYFIYEVWWKWNANPVIVSFNQEHVTVDEIPFPSVTICPEVKFKQSVFNYTRFKESIMTQRNNTENASENDFVSANVLGLVCYNKMSFGDVKFLDHFAIQRLHNLSADHKDIFKLCSWMGTQGNPKMLFKRVLTKEGVCYNFNGLAADEILKTENLQPDYNYSFHTTKRRNWSLSNGYFNKDRNAYPLRGTERNDAPTLTMDLKAIEPIRDISCNLLYSGYKTSHFLLTIERNLNFTLNLIVAKKYPYLLYQNNTTLNVLSDKPADWPLAAALGTSISACAWGPRGWQIYFHQPSDLPQALSYHFAVYSDQLASLAVTVSILTTSENLKSYPVKVRQCYFPEDRPLKYFRIYTYNNCKLECLTDYTFKKCGCVAFYMPFNDSKKICPAGRMEKCLSDSEASFTETEADNSEKERCDCLPSCNTVQYDAVIHNSKYHFESLYNLTHKNVLKEYLGSDNVVLGERNTVAKVNIYFKEPIFMPIHLSEFIGVTDFLGTCGGLLGLFFGLSLLSIVEIFYFLTFRVYNTIQNYLKNKKAENIRNT